MQLNNFVIECLDLQHGQKLSEFFKDKRIDASNYSFSCNKYDRDDCRYYGVINGVFDNYYYHHVVENNVEVLTLEEAITRFSGEVKEYDFIFGI
jgi:hypothetical protein